jgi:hypothetical protein
MASKSASGSSFTGSSSKPRRKLGVSGSSGGSTRKDVMTEDFVDAERSSLVIERQNELERVFARHDTLVC